MAPETGGAGTAPSPVAVWRAGRFSFPASRAVVMGILNVTPDSFSDGGTHTDQPAALHAARCMIADGAGIIDVGGESTRPGSAEVSEAEELRRVEGVVAALAREGACVSVDTRHAAVAAAAVEAGAAILNDIAGFRDPAMVSVAAGSDAGLVVMHMLGEPRTMQDAPLYTDVVAEVAEWLSKRAEVLLAAGVARERIMLDPGIGFGKTTAHNLELLRRLDELLALGYPVLVGASRKRFVGEITGVEAPRDRLAGSLAVALDAVSRGATVVRVHDVAETVRALRMQAAIDGGSNG